MSTTALGAFLTARRARLTRAMSVWSLPDVPVGGHPHPDVRMRGLLAGGCGRGGRGSRCRAPAARAGGTRRQQQEKAGPGEYGQVRLPGAGRSVRGSEKASRSVLVAI
ncbi:hypothetical protein [Micromonospora sp. NBC_01739]|uniref:hypothetical protein n=1 Tax=Micromonospora sp. NBC_01739 TaxID=2975985 RepID=UPI002E13488F|nr:hypothetical protein OIE53_10480 [Micromonospora sp. NBC_01739]